MKEIQIDTTNVGMAISAAEVAALQPEVATALSHLHNGTGAGNDFIGWVDLPTRTPEELIDGIMATAQDMRERCDTVVCIGIGGSYLGAKAVIHALSPAFPQPGEKSTEVVFAGHNISEDYLYELQQYLHDRRFGIIVISKSGCIHCPIEWRSVVLSTDAGNMPRCCLPSLSPYSCFHHSAR